MAARECVAGRVSVLCPTTCSRQGFHARLWQCFLDQTWADKELVVVETYRDRPSSFFEGLKGLGQEPRLVHVALAEELNIGQKRNLTVSLASGELLGTSTTRISRLGDLETQ